MHNLPIFFHECTLLFVSTKRTRLIIVAFAFVTNIFLTTSLNAASSSTESTSSYPTSSSTTLSIAETQLYRQAIPTTQNFTDEQSDTSIIGGEIAAEGAWPWMAAIIQDNGGNAFWSQFCAGTLIDPEWILTAAHCTYYSSGAAIDPHTLAVVIGRQQLTGADGEQIAVEKIVRHPLYDSAMADFDVALLKLTQASSQPIIKMVTPADLALEAADTPTVVIGWGRTDGKARVDNLLQVDVPLVSAEVCQNAYQILGYGITNRMICAGLAEGGKDACSGDSGGPLMVERAAAQNPDETEWLEVGIVSWGRGCALPDSYGVYTRVSEIYNWVVQHTGIAYEGDGGGTVILPDPSTPQPDEEGEGPKGQTTYSLFLPVAAR